MNHTNILKGRGRLICAALVLLLLTPSAFSQMASMKWTKIANFPEPVTARLTSEPRIKPKITSIVVVWLIIRLLP